jgi:dienelactone hydrolase
MASIIEGYTYDIFISYRQKDNKYDGWVTEFVDNLQRELESAFKEEISVYFDMNPHDGLLETYEVRESLKEKLKCLVFIPILSRTYCDPKAFAWENEFKAFINQASQDGLGLKVKLPKGNIVNRILPVFINDLNNNDKKLCESVFGGYLRGVDFVFKSAGVNRPLRLKEDNPHDNLNHIIYRDQINKVSLAIRDIIEAIEIEISDKQKKNQESRSNLGNEKTAFKDEISSEIEEGIKDSKTPGERSIKTFGVKILSIRNKKVIITVFLAVFILAVTIFLIYHNHWVKWARTNSIAEINSLVSEGNYIAGYKLAMKVEKYVANDPKFRTISIPKINISTDPPGADVFFREYSDINGRWQKIGRTPIDSLKLPPRTFYRVRIEKQGYENVLAAMCSDQQSLDRKLFPIGSMPLNMVYVDGYWEWDLINKKNSLEKSCGFFIDRYEVTNKEFKKFIDAGGYNNLKYWKFDFIKNGRKIDPQEAISDFVDKTGRPGPASWEVGNYPEGQGGYPVSGISWFEAAAYTDFIGKSLPTIDDWGTACGFFNYWLVNLCSKIAPLSNYRGRGPAEVGKNAGVNCFGAFDMAGNMREWCFNETNSGRVICGGGWDDISYMYSQWSQLSPFDRSAKNGLRCVKYLDPDKVPANAYRLVSENIEKDFTKEKPASDEIFEIYRNQFLYDKEALDPVIEKTDENPEDWVLQKISFNAAYGNEREIAYLYLPKNSSPPYQTMIYFPGTDAFIVKDLVNYINTKWYIDFILKSGRAVLYPVYKGTYERNEGWSEDISMPNPSHQYTEWVIRWVKDFSKSVDYLETRSDIDKDKLGFYGFSWGGRMGGIIPAVEKRLKVDVIYLGGFRQQTSSFPEVDPINYVQRIKIPVLMLNGRYDPFFPYETAVIPFYNMLGTPDKDKRRCVYETDHYLPRFEMIKETLSWLDHYLGPVK